MFFLYFYCCCCEAHSLQWIILQKLANKKITSTATKSSKLRKKGKKKARNPRMGRNASTKYLDYLSNFVVIKKKKLLLLLSPICTKHNVETAQKVEKKL